MLTISIVLQYNIHIVILFSSSDNPEDQMVKGVQSIAIKQLEKHHFEKKKSIIIIFVTSISLL